MTRLEQDALQLGEVFLALGQAGVGVAQVRRALQREDALGLVLDDVDATELSSLSHGASLGCST
jgi:hypothetical protein